MQDFLLSQIVHYTVACMLEVVARLRQYSTYTVQLRGKLTLASDSLASATAYTHECERCHSRTSVECSRVLHPSLACYSRVLDPSLACLILASARPLARVCYLRLLDLSLACVTCDCSTARSRVTCECWNLESSAHGPRPSARRGKLIRP